MLDIWEQHAGSTAAYVFIVVLGLLWGSFANVCIYRWPPSEQFPKGRSVVKPGSHCFACKQPISWYDNIPLIAWLWLRGQCRKCKAPFSARYLIVEATTGALFGVAWWFTVQHGMWWWSEDFDHRLIRFGIYAAFCFVMVVITFIDIDHKLILDKVTYPSIAAFYGLGFLLAERQWWEGLAGAAIGYGFPWLIGEVYYRVTGREGLGLGDSKLLAVIGALLGWKGVFVSLFGGAVVGSVIGIAILLRARSVRSVPAGVGQPILEVSREGQPADQPITHRTREGEAVKTPDLVAPAPHSAEPEGEASDEAPSLMRTELPFGPFLCMAAVFYLFAEPYLQLHFRFLGG